MSNAASPLLQPASEAVETESAVSSDANRRLFFSDNKLSKMLKQKN